MEIKGSLKNPYKKSGYGYKIFSTLNIRPLLSVDLRINKVTNKRKCQLGYKNIKITFDKEHRAKILNLETVDDLYDYYPPQDQGLSFFFNLSDTWKAFKRWNELFPKLSKERVITKIKYKNCIYRLCQAEIIFGPKCKLDIGICEEFTILEIIN